MLKDNIILFYKIEYSILFSINDSLERINKNKSIFKLGKVEDNKFYEWISYNKFKKTPEKIPELEQIVMPFVLVNNYLCGNNKKITNDVESIKKNKYKLFNSRSNYYLMSIINNKKILIFKKDEIETFENNIIDYYFFSRLYYLQFNNKIKTIYPKQIFIPKPTHNIYFGDIILLHLSNNKYLYWRYNQCYEFISYDLITKFDILLSIDTYLVAYAIDKLNNYYIINADSSNYHDFTIMTRNNINTSPKKLDKLFNLKIKLIYNNHRNNHYIDLDSKEEHELLKDYKGSVGIYKLKYEIPSWLLKTIIYNKNQLF
jgi:hypothetical protein